MADTIAIMNQGVIEQLGAPQEVYDRPASVFVADFIGSPSMNFLPFDGGYAAGARPGAHRRRVAARCRRCAKTCPSARCCAACGPSMCASPTTRRCAPRCWAPNTSAPARSSPADRAGRDAARQGRRRCAGAARRPGRPGLRRRRRCRCSTQRAAARCAPRATTRPAAHAPYALEPPMAELRLEGVGKRFGDVQAVRDLTLDVAQRRIHRAARPQRRRQDDHAAPGRRAREARRRPACTSAGATSRALAPALRDVTFVFQQYSLYPHLSVFDNLAFPLRSPLRPHGRGPGARARCTEVAQLLRIDDKLANPATKLSGGQMQRVAIGRALVREPAVTLMDEPLSSLDAKLRNDLRLELKRIQQDLGATHALRHARPDRGDDAGHPHRRARPRPRWCRWARRSRSTTTRSAATVAARLGLAAHQPAAARRAGRRCRRRRLRPPSACAPTARACAPANGHDSGHAQALVRRIELLSDQHLVHLALAGTASDIELVSAVPRRQRRCEPGRAVSVEFTAPLCFDAAGPAHRAPEPGATRWSHDTPIIEAAHADADRPCRRADRARPGDRRRRPRPEHAARRAGDPGQAAELEGQDAERRAQDHGHDLHVHHRRLVRARCSAPCWSRSARSCRAHRGAADLARALAAGIAALSRLGKAEVGQKTLLDVLDPVQKLLRRGRRRPGRARQRNAPSTAPQATAKMDAIKGRASFLGERALGHVDPGSRSMALIIGAFCDSARESDRDRNRHEEAHQRRRHRARRSLDGFAAAHADIVTLGAERQFVRRRHRSRARWR